MKKFLILMCLCCGSILSVAQTLTSRYVELADSADFYIKHSRWNDAERAIVAALRHEPGNKSNWLLWSNLGVVRTHLDSLDKALQAYDIGLASAPGSTVLLNNRAWTLLIAGRDPEALADLDRTLALDSLQAWPLKMRGLLNMTKAPDAARRDLTISDSLAPDDPAVIAGLADIDAATGNTAEAVMKYEKSLRLRPDEDVTFRLLLILTEIGNFTEAQTRTQEALAKWPKNPNLHIIRALQHQKNYMFDDSEREKNIAISYGAELHLVDRILNKKTHGKRAK